MRVPYYAEPRRRLAELEPEELPQGLLPLLYRSWGGAAFAIFLTAPQSSLIFIVVEFTSGLSKFLRQGLRESK